MTGFIQVMTTVDSLEDARTLASTIMTQRLAACVQTIGPMVSTYWWQGSVEESEQWLCLIKTQQELWPALNALIEQVHPYDVPELLAVPIVAGGEDYLAWMAGELRPGNKRQK